MEVGVRDLKNNLSRYLACVSAGAEIVVTHHSAPIAKITPMETERTFDRLIAEGIITPALSTKRDAPSSRIPTTKPVSPLVADQRH